MADGGPMSRSRGLFEIVSPSTALLGHAPRTPWWVAAIEWTADRAADLAWAALGFACVVAPVAVPVAVVLLLWH